MDKRIAETMAWRGSNEAIVYPQDALNGMIFGVFAVYIILNKVLIFETQSKSIFITKKA